MNNPNMPTYARRPLAVIMLVGIVAAGSTGCWWDKQSPPTPGRPYETPAAPPEPQPSTNQRRPAPAPPKCSSLKIRAHAYKPRTYRFTADGLNVLSDYARPNALVIDFGDGSNLYDSSDFGVSYTAPVEHEFPTEKQPHTYHITSGVRVNVDEGYQGLGENANGTVVPCPIREVVITPSAS